MQHRHHREQRHGYSWRWGVDNQMITRADISGALKVLNANNVKDRRKHLAEMVAY